MSELLAIKKMNWVGKESHRVVIMTESSVKNYDLFVT